MDKLKEKYEKLTKNKAPIKMTRVMLDNHKYGKRRENAYTTHYHISVN